jgi:hypothetical protein
MLLGVAISGDTCDQEISREDSKAEREVHCMQNVNTKVIPVITGATGIIP